MTQPKYRHVALLIVLLASRCGKEVPVAQDEPVRSVVLTQTAFDASSGGVTLAWVVQGQFLSVSVERRFGDNPYSEVVVLGPEARRYVDVEPVLGERITYRVRCRSGAGTFSSEELVVQIPGPRMGRMELDGRRGLVTISWESRGTILDNLTVVQTDSRGDRKTFAVNSESELRLGPLTGNRTYRFYLEAVSGGMTIRSRVASVGYYVRHSAQQIDAVPDSRTRLGITERGSGSPEVIAFTTSHGRSNVQFIPSLNRDSLGEWLPTYALATGALDPATIAFVEPNPQQLKWMVVGADKMTAQVSIHAFTRVTAGAVVIPEDGAPSYAWLPEQPDWRVGSLDGPLLAAWDEESRLFVLANDRIRAFKVTGFHLFGAEHRATIQDFGETGSGLMSTASDLMAFGGELWAATPQEGRIQRGKPEYSSDGKLVGVAWTPLGLDVFVTPSRIAASPALGLAILDMGAESVFILDMDGRLVTTVSLSEALGSSDVNTGDIAIVREEGRDVLYVLDRPDRVVRYVTELD